MTHPAVVTQMTDDLEQQQTRDIVDTPVRWPVVNALATEAFNAALEKAQEWKADPTELLVALQTAFIGLIAQMRQTKDPSVIGPLLRAQCEAMCQEFEDGLLPVEFTLEGN